MSSDNQGIIDEFVNAAHALQSAVEDYDRKTFKGVNLVSDLGYSETEANADLLPKIAPALARMETAFTALKGVIPE